MRNTVQHPIALHGTVATKRAVIGKKGPTNVLNLAKPKCIADTGDPDTGIGIEASIWYDDASWFADIHEGDQVVVLGMWKAMKGEKEPPSKPGKYPYQSFITHKLQLWPVLPAQVARID